MLSIKPHQTDCIHRALRIDLCPELIVVHVINLDSIKSVIGFMLIISDHTPFLCLNQSSRLNLSSDILF